MTTTTTLQAPSIPPGMREKTPIDKLTLEEVAEIRAAFEDMLEMRRSGGWDGEEEALSRACFEKHTQIFYWYPMLCGKVVKNAWSDQQIMEQIEWMEKVVREGGGNPARAREAHRNSLVESHWLQLARDSMLDEPAEFENILAKTCEMAADPERVLEVARLSQMRVLVEGLASSPEKFAEAEKKASTPECTGVFAAARRVAAAAAAAQVK